MEHKAARNDPPQEVYLSDDRIVITNNHAIFTESNEEVLTYTRVNDLTAKGWAGKNSSVNSMSLSHDNISAAPGRVRMRIKSLKFVSYGKICWGPDQDKRKTQIPKS